MEGVNGRGGLGENVTIPTGESDQSIQEMGCEVSTREPGDEQHMLCSFIHLPTTEYSHKLFIFLGVFFIYPFYTCSKFLYSFIQPRIGEPE